MKGAIAVLGAGAMGSAIATPLRRAGLEVRLWGTHLDTEIVGLLRSGKPHPRTGEQLPTGVEIFDHDQLADCLQGAGLVVIAVSSEGVKPTVEAAAPLLGEPRAVLLLSKGFTIDPAGRAELLIDTAERILTDGGVTSPVVAVGGPCKASEVAAGRTTTAVYAARDLRTAWRVGAELRSDEYGVETVDDVVGLESAAALKNVYAVGLGMCDGLADLGGQPWNGLKAMLFARALVEMSTIAEMLGGESDTVLGLAGTGDLELTGTAGRNCAYGRLIGGGSTPDEALAAMLAQGATVEGHAASTLARRLVLERAGVEFLKRVPLLAALSTCIGAGRTRSDIARMLAGAARPPYSCGANLH